jgi:NADPH:quinone reductase-like Zn-dependent oxidoreductase
MSETMRAIRLHAAGDPASLALEQLQAPAPGPGEAVIRVHAAAITRDELEWPADRLPATPSYELSGVVAAVGGAAGVGVADEVYALTPFDRDGAAADLVLVPASVLAPKPQSLDHVEAAAIPLPALSAWQGLFDHGRLTSGQRVLVHGGAGGVGGYAVQLARARGAHVVATASTANVGTARELGAHEVLDHASTRFEDAIEPVDLVFDTAGGDRLARSPAVIRRGGRLVSVATEPPGADGIDSVYFVVEPSRDQLVEIAALADRGQLRPVVDAVFPLEEARAAFERSLDRGGRGKIVLDVAGA